MGWAYVPSPDEVQFYNELDVKRAMNRGKNQPMPKPVPRPWEKPRDKEVLPPDAVSVARRERLKAKLGLGGAVDSGTEPH